MNSYFCLAVGLVTLGFLACRAGRIWIDTSQRGFGLARRLRWMLRGTMAPSSYWWRARIEALSPHEQADLLARETAALELSRADSLRCSLCEAEVPHAWVLASEGPPPSRQVPSNVRTVTSGSIYAVTVPISSPAYLKRGDSSAGAAVI
jgi:hypothetical protein